MRITGGILSTESRYQGFADGNFGFTDKLQELIKVRGAQVAPAELEALLLEHPQIMDVAVIGVPT